MSRCQFCKHYQENYFDGQKRRFCSVLEVLEDGTLQLITEEQLQRGTTDYTFFKPPLEFGCNQHVLFDVAFHILCIGDRKRIIERVATILSGGMEAMPFIFALNADESDAKEFFVGLQKELVHHQSHVKVVMSGVFTDTDYVYFFCS